MVQGLISHLRRLDKDLQVTLGLLLADVLLQRLGAQGKLSLILTGQRGGYKGLQLLGVQPAAGKINAQNVTSYLWILFLM